MRHLARLVARLLATGFVLLTAAVGTGSAQATAPSPATVRPALAGQAGTQSKPVATSPAPAGTGQAAKAKGSAAPARRWEVEFHAGGSFGSYPVTGTSGTLPAAESFVTIVGASSRRVSTWYVGEGATLLNQVNDAVHATQHITPLDTALTAASVERGKGTNIGGRVARVLSARWRAEATVDYSSASLGLTGSARSAIESSRASFITAWNGLIATGPFYNSNVTSTATLTGGSGGQLFVTGAVSYDLATKGRARPYVTAGLGVVSNLGTPPEIRMVGNYSFAISRVYPISETDTVTVRFTTPSSSLLGVFGGGVRYDLGRRWGLRADVRDYVLKPGIEVRIDASPSVATQSPAMALASFTSPSIQFSSRSTLTSTLSGPSQTDVRMFTGNGTAHRVGVSAGIYWRF